MAQAPYALLRRYGASAIRAARRGYCPGGAIRRFGLAIAPAGQYAALVWLLPPGAIRQTRRTAALSGNKTQKAQRAGSFGFRIFR